MPTGLTDFWVFAGRGHGAALANARGLPDKAGPMNPYNSECCVLGLLLQAKDNARWASRVNIQCQDANLHQSGILANSFMRR